VHPEQCSLPKIFLGLSSGKWRLCSNLKLYGLLCCTSTMCNAVSDGGAPKCREAGQSSPFPPLSTGLLSDAPQKFLSARCMPLGLKRTMTRINRARLHIKLIHLNQKINKNLCRGGDTELSQTLPVVLRRHPLPQTQISMAFNGTSNLVLRC